MSLTASETSLPMSGSIRFITCGAASTRAVRTLGDQGLGRLQADGAAADDHRPLRAGVDRLAQLDAVLEHRQPVHPGQVDAVDRRPQRFGPGVPAGPTGSSTTRSPSRSRTRTLAGVEVDVVDLVPGVDLDVLLRVLLGVRRPGRASP